MSVKSQKFVESNSNICQCTFSSSYLLVQSPTQDSILRGSFDYDTSFLKCFVKSPPGLSHPDELKKNMGKNKENNKEDGKLNKVYLQSHEIGL